MSRETLQAKMKSRTLRPKLPSKCHSQPLLPRLECDSQVLPRVREELIENEFECPRNPMSENLSP